LLLLIIWVQRYNGLRLKPNINLLKMLKYRLFNDIYNDSK